MTGCEIDVIVSPAQVAVELDYSINSLGIGVGAIEVALLSSPDIVITPETVNLELLYEYVGVTVSDVGAPGPPGPPGPQGAPGSSTGMITLERHTAQILSGHRVVTPRTSDGWLVYADKFTMTDVERPFWLTTGSWDADVDATVVTFGMVAESSWNWTTGKQVYLNGDGLLTQTAPDLDDLDNPAFMVCIGRAASPTELFFDPVPPIAFRPLEQLDTGYQDGYGPSSYQLGYDLSDTYGLSFDYETSLNYEVPLTYEVPLSEGGYDVALPTDYAQLADAESYTHGYSDLPTELESPTLDSYSAAVL